jgi:holo-[acyl-carrier protein] synthase
MAEDTLDVVFPDGFHFFFVSSMARIGILCPSRPRSKGRPFPMCYRPPREAALVVVGVGLDLVELDRVERALERWGERLVAKLMDGPEAVRLPADGAGRARALALAIAGQEAAAKAIGTGWSRGVFWRDVIVEPGPPAAVTLRRRAAEVARGLGSRGRTRTHLEVRGNLVLGEVWLLA